MSTSEINQMKRSLNSIYTASSILQDSFVDKKVSYVGELSTIEVIFSTTNFMHLCGIEYKRGTSLFFQDSLDRKINLNHINVKSDGTTFQKLQVIGSIGLLLERNISIVGNGVYSSLKYDAAIRTKKKIIALSLKQNAQYYVPISLLNLSSKELGSGQKVIRIVSEDLTSGEIKNIMVTEN